MRQGIFEILDNRAIAKNTYQLTLRGDTSAVAAPGQFVNIRLEGFYLRRPLSVCDCEGDILTLIYKTVGSGTAALSALRQGECLDLLSGLGNGYDTRPSGPSPLLIGGGAGVPPLYLLARRLLAEGKTVRAVLGFGSAQEVFYTQEFAALGVQVTVATADGSAGVRGFVTDALGAQYSYTYACGPEAMLRAVYDKTEVSGQYSFEERMGCGFGACMGCSCRTKYGAKRICRDGPVLLKEEIIW